MGNVNSTERNESNVSNESNESNESEQLLNNGTIDVTITNNSELELDIAAEEIQHVAAAYLNAKLNNNREIKKLKQQIHDILFEEKESIPEGIYIKLMNVIKN